MKRAKIADEFIKAKIKQKSASLFLKQIFLKQIVKHISESFKYACRLYEIRVTGIFLASFIAHKWLQRRKKYARSFE